jgi:hypothetical protein
MPGRLQILATLKMERSRFSETSANQPTSTSCHYKRTEIILNSNRNKRLKISTYSSHPVVWKKGIRDNSWKIIYIEYVAGCENFRTLYVPVMLQPHCIILPMLKCFTPISVLIQCVSFIAVLNTAAVTGCTDGFILSVS